MSCGKLVIPFFYFAIPISTTQLQRIITVTCQNRSRELDRESASVGGNCAAILQGVGVQAIVTEILVQFADLLFSDNRVDGDDTEKGSKRK